jgi:hypothetical protein
VIVVAQTTARQPDCATILGVDPGSIVTGWGLVELEGNQLRHVANGVRYMASLPLDANVQFMTVMATKMPYIGRG